ncbi:Mobile element protein [Candidatus Enterovibrio escicola]|uniref:Mobile element protein n=1 Tax=Candidatus Enterovibrio escicola TaxID=1927127 RepID=A0A2A5SZU7_9GAMM|nr:Mobile element protein [Candidatus Enterovibrio escacola]
MNNRKPVSEMVDEHLECLYGDKGYISDPLERELADKGVILITGLKNNIKQKVMKLWRYSFVLLYVVICFCVRGSISTDFLYLSS